MLVALAFHARLLLLATYILWSPAPSQQGSRSSRRWLRSSLDDVAEKESTNETILRLPPGAIGKEIPAAALSQQSRMEGFFKVKSALCSSLGQFSQRVLTWLAMKRKQCSYGGRRLCGEGEEELRPR